ncbi:MAG: UbiA family prenyltransferase [Chitinivibrionales bacterium]|nr:UbiA family prenyltransferase [Chitinivibrionales bacterium]
MLMVTRIVDYFFLTRPVILIPVWGFSVFGYWRGSSLHQWSDIQSVYKNDQISICLYCILFSISVAAVYVFNQIADRDVDTRNGGCPLLIRCSFLPSQTWIYAFSLAALSIGAPLVTPHPSISLFSALTVVTGILYSFKPTFFSGRPGLDFLSNAFGFGCIAFGVGWSLATPESVVSMHFLRDCSPYFLLMCAGSISSTLPDINGDRACGKNTTAVVLGAKTATLLAFSCICIAAVAAALQHDSIALICSATAMPFYLIYMTKPTQQTMEATYKVGGGIMMIVAVIIFPVLIVPSLLISIATVVYFRLRHHVLYPSLTPMKTDNCQKNSSIGISSPRS